MAHPGGGPAANRRLRGGGIAPKTRPRKRSGRQHRGFGHVRTNRGRGKDFPRVQRSGEPPDIVPGGGEGNFPTRASGKGLVRAPRTVWRASIDMGDGAVAPSTATAKVLTNATLSSSERVAGDPTGDQRKALLRLIHSIYGGWSLPRWWGVDPGVPGWQIGFPTNLLTRTEYPVCWVKTPPKLLLVLG